MYKDIQNQRFGKLIALEYKYTQNKKAFWLCECDCGNISIISASNLQSGHTKSCGCIRFNSDSNNLSKHFRNLLKYKIKDVLDKSNHTCALTGNKNELEVHHLNSFNNMYIKAINDLGYLVYNNISQYTQEQLYNIDKLFLEMHDVKSLIVISKNIHTNFHRIYGYKNNNEQQFNEFIKNFY